MNINTLTGFCAAQEGLVGEALPLQPGAGVAAAPGLHSSKHHEGVPFNLLSETTLNTLVEAMAGGEDGSHGNGRHRWRYEEVLLAGPLSPEQPSLTVRAPPASLRCWCPAGTSWYCLNRKRDHARPSTADPQIN